MADARRRLDPLDVVAGLAVVAWLGWVVTAAILTGRPLPLTSAYLVAPLMAVAGVVAGRLLAARAPRWPVAEALLAVTAFIALEGLLTPGPGNWPLRYDNANAALGLQLLALVGVASLTRWQPRPEPLLGLPDDPGWTRRVHLVAGLAAVAIVVINNSQAGLALLVPVALGTLLAAWTRWGPWRAVSVTVGLASLGAAAAGLLWLASRDEWPPLAVRALSRVRQEMWQVALTLWRGEGLTGAGPGRYREVNPFGADPDTATAHSSLLQVGADLGHVGVALFGVLLLVGVALAARRGRAEALIAVAAWTALGVHSFMDHLYEFPALTFTAAAVLGWASAPPSEQLDVPEGEAPG